MSLKKNISLDRNNKIIVRRSVWFIQSISSYYFFDDRVKRDRVKNDSAKSDKAKRIKSSDRIEKSSTIIK